jgi:hypothetical protein
MAKCKYIKGERIQSPSYLGMWIRHEDKVFIHGKLIDCEAMRGINSLGQRRKLIATGEVYQALVKA